MKSLLMLRRIFLFLLCVLALLYGLTILGEHMGTRIFASSWLPQPDQLPFLGRQKQELPKNDVVAERIEEISLVDSLAQVLEDDHDEPDRAAVPVKPIDSVETPPKIIPPPIPSGIKIVPLEYRQEGGEQLEKFFDALASEIPQGKQVRVFHYGDSQIEGDRISSFLRARLQKEFGGGGIGLISAVPPRYQPYGYSIKPSDGWAHYSMMPLNKRIKGMDYGILGEMSRYTQSQEMNDSTIIVLGSVTTKRKRRVGRGVRFTQIRILMRNPFSPSEIQMSVDSLTRDTVLPPSPKVHQAIFQTSATSSPVTVEFSGAYPGEVHALSFETPSGIQVDNIPLRGSSGSDFSAISDSVFLETAHLLPVRLILLQFGVNVVPGKKSASYDWYRALLVRHISRLQRLFPESAFILMGVSDMGEKVGEQVLSYSNIPMILHAQRQAARQTGIAFWNSREAMGGENAIISWVEADPPLATKDYVHFTPRGARFMAEMFYASLMNEYANYLKHSAADEN